MFNYDKFLQDATRSYYEEKHSQRYGQYLMNYVSKKHPGVYVEIKYDCYYDDEKVPFLLDYLYRLSQKS